jgi:hypothetical protein
LCRKFSSTVVTPKPNSPSGAGFAVFSLILPSILVLDCHV